MMSSSNFKISVITVVYNGNKFFEECIESVFNQSYQNIEYIIIDGGSTDGTVDTIRRYDSKIAFWVSEKDGGIYEAMNKGIDHATGDFLMFLGSDDVLLPGFSGIVSEFSDVNTVYYGNVTYKGYVCFGEFSDYKVCKYQIPHQATFYPRSVFDIYRYEVKYKTAADYALTMRCKADKRFTFEYKNYLVAIFREGGASTNKDILFEKERGRLIRQLFGKTSYFRFKFHELKVKLRRKKY